MFPTLLYINTIQFGYHIDSYKHCQHLKQDFKVIYICYDYGYPRVKEFGIDINYVPWSGSYWRKGARFMRYCLGYMQRNKINYVFAIHFPLISIFKLLAPNKNIILDIRTGSINKSRRKRIIFNKLIWFDSLFFHKITVISESLVNKLNIQKKRTLILPLGADILSNKNKSFKSLRLFYIGTLDGRNIQQSIYGLKLFLDKFNDHNINVTYDIVGYGSEACECLINKAIEDSRLQEKVMFHGRKTHDESMCYFDNCNIGVSYIPITEYYDCQPPTKTYEYINAGMACIATETLENKKLINFENGVLCQDNPEGFCNALLEVSQNPARWDSLIIRGTLSNFSWANISEKLKNYILNLHPENHKATKEIL